MTALTDNRQTERKDGELLQLPCGVDIVYRGGMVCLNTSGYAVAAQDTASFRFAGVAYEKKDNSSGSAGDEDVRVYRSGLHKFAGTGFAITDVGKRVYVSDDQTVTLTPGNVFAGVIADYESATAVWVDIGPAVEAGNGDKITVSANVRTVADTTVYGLAFVCPAGRKATVLAAKVVAMVKPVYATDELLNLYNYDLSATSEEAVLETADYDLDGLTAKQAADLTLQSTTPANLDMDPGDALYVAVACTGAETTAGDIGVTFEIALN